MEEANVLKKFHHKNVVKLLGMYILHFGVMFTISTV